MEGIFPEKVHIKNSPKTFSFHFFSVFYAKTFFQDLRVTLLLLSGPVGLMRDFSISVAHKQIFSAPCDFFRNKTPAYQ